MPKPCKGNARDLELENLKRTVGNRGEILVEKLLETSFNFYRQPDQDVDLSLKYGRFRRRNVVGKSFEPLEDELQYWHLANFNTEFIQNTLVHEYGLRKVMFPEERHVGPGPTCPIFMSESFYSGDYNTNSKKEALILIQAVGSKSYIRAGEWAKHLCVYEDLYTGSMLP